MRTVTPRRMVVSCLVSGLIAFSLLAASPASAITQQQTTFIRAIYGDILDRAPNTGDNNGINFWANQLNNRPRYLVTRGIMFSGTEYFGSVLNVDYAIYLDRSPDAGAYDYYTNARLNLTLTEENVVTILVGSQEYYNKQGGTLDAYVNAAYFDILGRQPDAGGFNYFKGVAMTQGRSEVARQLINSTEVRTTRVKYQYNNFLARPVDQPALNYWLGQINAGLRDENFDLALVSSDEYYAKNS